MGHLGYNPTPSISLGDMERIIEASNIEGTSVRKLAAPPSKDELLKQFMIVQKLPRIQVPESVVQSKDSSNQVESLVDHSEINDELEKKRLELENRREEARKKKELELKRMEAEIEREEAEAERIEQERLATFRLKEKQRIEAENRAKMLQEAEDERLRQIEESNRQEQLRQTKLKQQQAQEEQLRQERAYQEQLRLEKAEEARRKQEQEYNEQLKKETELREKMKKLEELKQRRIAATKKQEVQSKPREATVSKGNSTERIENYSKLEVDSLFREVKQFVIDRGMARKIIDKSMLELEFGRQNISKLILKSYLISIGKGVTFGNG